MSLHYLKVLVISFNHTESIDNLRIDLTLIESAMSEGGQKKKKILGKLQNINFTDFSTVF